MALFIPTYFSPIAQYRAIIQQPKITFEVSDNFQKQTYRNRCYIYSSNGKLLLNIPVKHTKNTVKKTSKDVQIDYSTSWQKQHLKSLQTAYKSSPFFEFYIDDLLPIFEKKHTFLLDLNLQCHHIIMEALQEEISFTKTTEYKTEIISDFRYLANAKKELAISFPRYIQVFDDKHGFIPNLSILDLLFMEGPNSASYLKNIVTSSE